MGLGFDPEQLSYDDLTRLLAGVMGGSTAGDASMQRMPGAQRPPVMASAAPAAPLAAAPVNPAAAQASVAAVRPPPQYQPVDLAKRAQFQEMERELQKPTDSSKVKPKWYDRMFGGMATFGAAMQHNPNAVGIGTDIVNRRYNAAE